MQKIQTDAPGLDLFVSSGENVLLLQVSVNWNTIGMSPFSLLFLPLLSNFPWVNLRANNLRSAPSI